MKILKYVRVDTRSLAVFRVILGVLIVVDVLLRSRNFGYFYTDEGIFPQSLAERAVREETAVNWSLYYISSEPAFTALLFIVTAVVGVQLAVGYRTRLATVLGFVLVTSLDFRNLFVLSYADTLFRLLLFWGIFLPLGERWSVDAVHRSRTPRESVAGVASALVLGQMVVMYLANGYHKLVSDDVSWANGEAAVQLLAFDEITFLLGDYMLTFPTLVQYGGAAWFYMLLASPLLLFLHGRPRAVFAAAFTGVHVFFALTLRIGAFPYVAIAGLFLFVQPRVWEAAARVSRRLGFEPSRIFPRLSVLETVLKRLPDISSLDSEAYDRTARATYSLVLATVVISIALFAIFSYTPVGDAMGVSPDESIDTAASTLGVSQPSWDVYAYFPAGVITTYYVFPAHATDGRTLDVYNNRELSFDRPYEAGHLHKQYDTYRERFYMTSLSTSARVHGVEEPARILAQYHCDTWTEDGAELTHVNMYRVVEQIEMETVYNVSERSTRTTNLYRHGCGENDSEVIR